mgnify:FL=1
MTIPVKHMTRVSQSFAQMTRGDQVYIVSGTWKGHRGKVVFVDHLDNLTTVALDEGTTHMVKTDSRNVVRVISNGDVV